MRTTLRIPDDLMRAIKERARREQVSMATVVSDCLRRGLEREKPQPIKFRQKTHNMGKPLIDLTKASAFAAQLEDEEILKKMSLGK